MTSLPIWAFHGEKDEAVPVSGTRDMIDSIKEAGELLNTLSTMEQVMECGLKPTKMDKSGIGSSSNLERNKRI